MNIIKGLVIVILALIALKMSLGIAFWLLGKVLFWGILGISGFVIYKAVTQPKNHQKIQDQY